jgi:hypothetical protein
VGDPLCFILEHPAPGASVTIGRAEGNDIVLSDQTVSRHHCTLVWNGAWTAASADAHAVFALDGHPVPPGRFVTVPSGAHLTLGHLELVHYTSQGMLLRLAAKLARR